jgi:hypothetical protein
VLETINVVDPNNGSMGSALMGTGAGTQKVMIAVLPQLGDFDSAEYGEQVILFSVKLFYLCCRCFNRGAFTKAYTVHNAV